MNDMHSRLRKARQAAGYRTASEAARRFGWNAAAYRHHENGTSGFRAERARDYAEAYGVSPQWLLYGDADADIRNTPNGLRPIRGKLPVMGKVEAGAWREVVPIEAREVEEWLPIELAGFEGTNAYALQVSGPSMNKVYPEGRYVVVVPAAEAGVRAGDFVVVMRMRNGLAETTVKELVMEGDRVALWPRSFDSRHQDPIYIDSELGSDEVEIVGVVMADYGVRVRPPPLYR